jgi:D-3-phosphoglycerate dehydrogenase
LSEKIKVLLFHPTINQDGVDYLNEHAEVILAPDSKTETIRKYIKNVDGLIARMEMITSEVMDWAENLKVVGQNGVGVDNIDVKAATERNIAVVNAPTANFTSVAEHVTMYVLTLPKRVVIGDYSVRNDNWNIRDENLPHEVRGKTMYLVGFGRNARETARILIEGLKMKVKAYDPYVSEEQMTELGVQYVPNLENGFKEADFVSLHLPATVETYHLFDKRIFDLMENCYFINCARGTIVDYDALYDAIMNGNVSYAGLDVLDPEPPVPGNRLFGLKNVIFTPHNAGDTLEAKKRTAVSVAKDVVRVIEGKMPEGLVNKELAVLYSK